MGRLFDIQCILGQDDPGIIGIQMVTGEEGHTAEIDAYIAFADTFTSGPTGMAASAWMPISGLQGRQPDAPRHRRQSLPTHFVRQDAPGQRQSTRVGRNPAIDQQDVTTAVLFEHIV